VGLTVLQNGIMTASAPRKVRLNRPGIILVAGFLSLYLLALSMEFSSVRRAALAHQGTGVSFGDVICFAGVIAVTFFFWRMFAREKRLLREGTATLGVVTKTERSIRGQRWIRYSFTDSYGTAHERTSLDLTGKFREGVAVSVFYNPSNPGEYLCIAGAFHRIIAE
jgi:hypothetical protein